MLMLSRSCSLTIQIALSSTLSSLDYMKVSGHLLTQWGKVIWSHGTGCGTQAVKEQEFLKEQIQTKIAAKHFLELFRMELCQGCIVHQSMPCPNLTLTWCNLSSTTPVGISTLTQWSLRRMSQGLTQWATYSGCLYHVDQVWLPWC